MLYPALRLIAGVALRWYYREVTLVGAGRVPDTGPVILAVNHPNALVDALVVGWLVRRRIRITAKAVLFDQPVLGAFLRAMGVIPLRRASDELAKRRSDLRHGTAAAAAARPDPRRNVDAFDAILDALDDGAAILIFPEGKSHDDSALAPLKTGPARIALTAREANRAPGLRIVPIGLVFESKEAPRSRVAAVVGESIRVHEWQAPPGVARQAEALTDEIARRLRDVTLSAPTAERLEQVQRVARLVTAILAPAAPPVGADQSLGDEYAVAARVARGLDTLPSLPPDLRQRATRALAEVEAFGRDLQSAGVAETDAAISLRKRHGVRFVAREVALLVLAGPVAAWGRITHWIPFRLARRAALRDVTARDQPAMRTIVWGLALTLINYAAQVAIVWALLGGWAALAHLTVLPIAADVDLRYSDRLRTAGRRMRTYLRLRRTPKLATRLAERRRALADEIRAVDAVFRELAAGRSPSAV